jgi:dihydropteroate synthase
MKLANGVVLLSILALSACETTPDMKKAGQMKAELEAAKTNIAQLQIKQTELQKELAEQTRVNSVLGVEKTSRVQESSELRGQVRQFVQKQIDAYKDFLVQGGLLDYIGGELVERAKVENKPILVIDLAHPVPKTGTLTGVGGHFVKGGKFSVKVLRQIDKSLVVIWDSKPLLATKTGITRINFPVSVGVEQGDLIGYYLDEGVEVSFDEGTGNSRFQSEDEKLGASISITSLQGDRSRRAYSLGVYGLLN